MAIIKTRMSDYKTFRRFLQEQQCEDAFDRAFYQYNDFTLLDEALWEASNAECIFGHAFDWKETPEGRDFWLNIDRIWNIKIKQNYGTI